ncbi:MAG: SPOR domain-containing protein [Desulfobulbaceae bacterium]|jgi:hypothetical protein|nr:SPOR domain-containing protein [Desulfobulbaceae bacterium]
MAKNKSPRKRKFSICFELGLGGLLGLTTIVFCVFLWMFFLGIWAGQTVLLPSGTSDTARTLNRFASDLWQRGETLGAEARASVPAPLETPGKKQVQAADDEVPSVFSLQMGSYDRREEAKQEVLSWQAKGEDSFMLPPNDGENSYRVFIGRFADLTEANAKVDEFEDDMQVQAFITLLPASGGGH